MEPCWTCRFRPAVQTTPPVCGQSAVHLKWEEAPICHLRGQHCSIVSPLLCQLERETPAETKEKRNLLSSNWAPPYSARVFHVCGYNKQSRQPQSKRSAEFGNRSHCWARSRLLSSKGRAGLCKPSAVTPHKLPFQNAHPHVVTKK